MFKLCKKPCCSRKSSKGLFTKEILETLFLAEKKNSGMVKITNTWRQLAYLLPNSVMLANGRVSETERVLAINDSLNNLRLLKIQST